MRKSLFLSLAAIVLVATVVVADTPLLPGEVKALTCSAQPDGRWLVSGAFEPAPSVEVYGNLQVFGAVVGGAPANESFAYIFDVGKTNRAFVALWPNIRGSVRWAECAAALQAPQRRASQAGESMPERDKALERLLQASQGLIGRLALGQVVLPALPSASLRLESDPVEEFTDARLVLSVADPKPRGVGWVLQFTSDGKLQTANSAIFPLGLHPAAAKQFLPVKDFREGSGRLVLVYIAEDWRSYGGIGILSMSVNYPLFTAQPMGGGIEVLSRTRRELPEPGYEYILTGPTAMVAAVAVDGKAVREVWATQLPDSENRQTIFLPLRAMDPQGLGANLARVVEVTFCTAEGQCASDALTPRLKAPPTQAVLPLAVVRPE